MKTLTTIYIVCLAALLLNSGCRKFVDVPVPANALAASNVFTNDGTAISALDGIYAEIVNGGINAPGGLLSLSYFPALSADELSLYSQNSYYSPQQTDAYYANKLNASASGEGWEYWNGFYGVIYQANSAIAELRSSSGLTPSIKNQLTGEAEFVRALHFFYLVNLYGDVPLVTSTDYKANTGMARTAKNLVYQQIIADLTDAESKLSANYLDGSLRNTSAERFRPTKWAAAALLARVYLYYGDLSGDASNYKNAVTQCALLTQNNPLFSLSTLSNAFLDAPQGNNEAIWQMQPVQTGFNSQEAPVFVLPASGPSDQYAAYASNQLVQAFEAGDQRKLVWLDSVQANGTTYYYPYKYKVNVIGQPLTESQMVLRLGEQYLIKAEAEAELNDLADAAADLNVVRSRAGLGNTSASTQSGLLKAILQERRVELFTELGQRWLDLKRSGNVNAVMSLVTPLKGGTWSPDWALYPLPQTDLSTDRNLKQNPGY